MLSRRQLLLGSAATIGLPLIPVRVQARQQIGTVTIRKLTRLKHPELLIRHLYQDVETGRPHPYLRPTWSGIYEQLAGASPPSKKPKSMREAGENLVRDNWFKKDLYDRDTGVLGLAHEWNNRVYRAYTGREPHPTEFFFNLRRMVYESHATHPIYREARLAPTHAYAEVNSETTESLNVAMDHARIDFALHSAAGVAAIGGAAVFLGVTATDLAMGLAAANAAGGVVGVFAQLAVTVTLYAGAVMAAGLLLAVVLSFTVPWYETINYRPVNGTARGGSALDEPNGVPGGGYNGPTIDPTSPTGFTTDLTFTDATADPGSAGSGGIGDPADTNFMPSVYEPPQPRWVWSPWGPVPLFDPNARDPGLPG